MVMIMVRMKIQIAPPYRATRLYLPPPVSKKNASASAREIPVYQTALTDVILLSFNIETPLRSLILFHGRDKSL